MVFDLVLDSMITKYKNLADTDAYGKEQMEKKQEWEQITQLLEELKMHREYATAKEPYIKGNDIRCPSCKSYLLDRQNVALSPHYCPLCNQKIQKI